MSPTLISPMARKGLLGFALCCALLVALWIGRAPVHLPLLVAGAAVLFLATLLNNEAGLVILVLSMLLSPEIALGSGGGASLEGSRNLVLRTEDLILLLVGLAWFARMAIHKDLGAVRRTRLNAFIGAYTACCLVSTLIGIEVGRVRPVVGLCYVTKYIEYFIIFFITVNYVRTPEKLRRLLAALLITAGLICVYAYWQMPAGVRPSAPFEGPKGEPNTLGGYLVMIFSVAAAIALTVPHPGWRRACAVLAIGTVPPLLATLSRSSWLAMGGTLLALLILSPSRRRLAAAIIVGGALLLLVQPENVVDRVAYTFQGREDTVAFGEIRLDPSSSARLSSWRAAIGAFTQHPFLGWGVTGYGFLDAQYFRVLVELGLVGFAAFAGLLAAIGRSFYRCFTSLGDPLHRALALGMTAAFVGLLLHSVGANTFILIRIMEPFWLLTGLVLAAQALETAHRPEEIAAP
jgi:O-antigen ligase